MDGVLRVGGRIEKAEIPWESKHPVILDHGHDVTRLIVIHYHRKLIHAGVEHVFNHVREKYWILHGRAKVKNCTVKCPLCFRRRVKPMTQKMANLPNVRLAGQVFLFDTLGLIMPDRLRLELDAIERKNAIFAYLRVSICARFISKSHIVWTLTRV